MYAGGGPVSPRRGGGQPSFNPTGGGGGAPPQQTNYRQLPALPPMPSNIAAAPLPQQHQPPLPALPPALPSRSPRSPASPSFPLPTQATAPIANNTRHSWRGNAAATTPGPGPGRGRGSTRGGTTPGPGRGRGGWGSSITPPTKTTTATPGRLPPSSSLPSFGGVLPQPPPRPPLPDQHALPPQTPTQPLQPPPQLKVSPSSSPSALPPLPPRPSLSLSTLPSPSSPPPLPSSASSPSLPLPPLPPPPSSSPSPPSPSQQQQIVARASSPSSALLKQHKQKAEALFGKFSTKAMTTFASVSSSSSALTPEEEAAREKKRKEEEAEEEEKEKAYIRERRQKAEEERRKAAERLKQFSQQCHTDVNGLTSGNNHNNNTNQTFKHRPLQLRSMHQHSTIVTTTTVTTSTSTSPVQPNDGSPMHVFFRFRLVGHSTQHHRNKDYTVYQVEVEWTGGMRWTVQRRYNQFFELDQALKKANLPPKHPLPPKQMNGNLDPTFVQGREASLKLFVEGINEMRTQVLESPKARKTVFRFFAPVQIGDEKEAGFHFPSEIEQVLL
ncbi:hypothetical protein QOT17_018610 [Balamuthia mandrillaris]